MLRAVGGLIVALWSASCNAAPPEVSSAQTVVETCPPISDSFHYFHKDVAVLPAGFTEQDRQWVSDYLRAVGADSLSCGGPPREAYRMLYVQSSLPAYVVSVSKEDSVWLVDGAEFGSTPRPFLVARRARTSRSTDEVQPLLNKLRAANVWTSMPSWIESEVEDGGLWIVEARRDREYRIVMRHAPRAADEPFRETVREFMRLAGWAVPEVMTIGAF
jgi:hypothetical protein